MFLKAIDLSNPCGDCIPTPSWNRNRLVRWSWTDLELLHSGLDLGVAHVLLPHQVVVHTRLGVTHDEESAAHLANLHLLLLGRKALNCLEHKAHTS